jgi:hypothetical protein
MLPAGADAATSRPTGFGLQNEVLWTGRLKKRKDQCNLPQALLEHATVLRAPFAFFLLILSFPVANAEGRRVALVVGVSQYEHAPALANTLNDARDTSAALRRLNFDVETVLDPTRVELESAIRRYGDKSADAEASVFHYSGHALEATGHNWLLPTTMNLNNARDLRFEAIDLNTVLEQTDGAKVSIIFPTHVGITHSCDG